MLGVLALYRSRWESEITDALILAYSAFKFVPKHKGIVRINLVIESWIYLKPLAGDRKLLLEGQDAEVRTDGRRVYYRTASIIPVADIQEERCLVLDDWAAQASSVEFTLAVGLVQ